MSHRYRPIPTESDQFGGVVFHQKSGASQQKQVVEVAISSCQQLRLPVYKASENAHGPLYQATVC